jgi:hypothetical protein
MFIEVLNSFIICTKDQNESSATLNPKRKGPGRPRKYPKIEPLRKMKVEGTGTEPSSSSDIGDSEGKEHTHKPTNQQTNKPIKKHSLEFD